MSWRNNIDHNSSFLLLLHRHSPSSPSFHHHFTIITAITSSITIIITSWDLSLPSSFLVSLCFLWLFLQTQARTRATNNNNNMLGTRQRWWWQLLQEPQMLSTIMELVGSNSTSSSMTLGSLSIGPPRSSQSWMRISPFTCSHLFPWIYLVHEMDRLLTSTGDQLQSIGWFWGST